MLAGTVIVLGLVSMGVGLYDTYQSVKDDPWSEEAYDCYAGLLGGALGGMEGGLGGARFVGAARPGGAALGEDAAGARAAIKTAEPFLEEASPRVFSEPNKFGVVSGPDGMPYDAATGVRLETNSGGAWRSDSDQSKKWCSLGQVRYATT